jgi:hypothetical protein
MTEPRETAKIIPFPRGRRTNRDEWLGGSLPAADKLPPGVEIVWGSDWYHDAAIREDRASRH